MPATVKEMMENANAAVPRVAPSQAHEMAARGEAVILDVRELNEVQASGKAQGAIHIPRGSLEWRADEAAPSHDKNLSRDKTVIVYCAAGSRAALAGKTLKDMGYKTVLNLGGFKDWAEAGLPVER